MGQVLPFDSWHHIKRQDPNLRAIQFNAAASGPAEHLRNSKQRGFANPTKSALRRITSREDSY
jgi:hypothetical protein